MYDQRGCMAESLPLRGTRNHRDTRNNWMTIRRCHNKPEMSLGAAVYTDHIRHLRPGLLFNDLLSYLLGYIEQLDSTLKIHNRLSLQCTAFLIYTP